MQLELAVSIPRGKQWGHEGGRSDNISLQSGAMDAGGKGAADREGPVLEVVEGRVYRVRIEGEICFNKEVGWDYYSRDRRDCEGRRGGG